MNCCVRNHHVVFHRFFFQIFDNQIQASPYVVAEHLKDKLTHVIFKTSLEINKWNKHWKHGKISPNLVKLHGDDWNLLHLTRQKRKTSLINIWLPSINYFFVLIFRIMRGIWLILLFFLEQLIELTLQQLTVLRKMFIYIARSFVPDSRRQIDKTMEETII